MKKILFVCTGNTCRSPIAAALMKSLFPNFSVDSAGLFADGSAYSEKSAAVLSEMGIELSGFSRQLSCEDLDADMIFCMTQSHRDMLISVGADKNKIRVLDVCDPYGGDTDVYRACRDEIYDKLSSYKYSIRPMEKGDISAVAEIEKQCFSSPWSEEAISDSFDNGTMFFVAENKNGVIGYSGVQITLDEAYVYNIATSPFFRGFGVGTALTEKLSDCAKEKGASFISLEVRESNQTAISIYEKIGFKEVGKRKNFYSSPREDGIIMTKVIK